MQQQAPILVVLVRHALSLMNAVCRGFCFADEAERVRARHMCGGVIADQDIPLADEGPAQAEHCGKVLRNDWHFFPDEVYISPYRRTRQTYDGISLDFPSVRQPSVKLDTRLRERESGYVAHMTREEIAVAFPWLAAYWREVGDFYARNPSGESLVDVVDKRVRPFLHDLTHDSGGRRKLVVTHGNTIKCFRYLMEGHSEDWLRKTQQVIIANCAIYSYSYDPATGLWRPSSRNPE